MNHHPTPTRHAALIALCAALLTAACDKTPINGPLDGMWQLMSIETPQGVRDVEQQRVFLSFQLHLTQWEMKNAATTFYAHFHHSADSIRFYDFAHRAMHDLSADDNDHWVTPEEMNAGAMDAWGIHTTDARFRVLKLTHKRLLLQTADTTLNLRKF